jgi:Cd2+/Zn2+-exporting ATPase
MQTVLQLDGLDCAVCAAELEEKISKIQGVNNASVAFATQKLSLEYDSAETLDKVIYAANHFEEVRVVLRNEKNALNAVDGIHETTDDFAAENAIKKRRNEWLRMAISAVCFIFGAVSGLLSWTVVSLCGYLAAYVAVAYPIWITTVKNISKGNVFDENFLMTIASVGAMCLGEFAESVAVMWLYQLGETLQAMAVGSSRRSITNLMDLKAECATKIVKGEQVSISAKDVQKGDILLVKAGEKVPVDGCLLSATADLDTKSLTGEPQIKTLNIGGELLSGYVNAGGVFKMQALKAYEDSAAQKILELVENAASSKAKPEKFITKFAKYYTPAVCAIAAFLALVMPLLQGLLAVGSLQFYAWERWLRSALTFLVVSCPCALVVSVPLTYFSGIGACAKVGVLIKGATYLDVLSQAKTIAFDKTGTLTEGNFTVVNAHSATELHKDELLSLVVAVEKNSAHPIAKAFNGITTPYKAVDAYEYAGEGISAWINGENVLVGNGELMKRHSVEYVKTESVHTLVYVAKNGEYLGYIELGDKIKDEAKTAVKSLQNAGFTKTVMLTGDSKERALAVAKEVGVYEVNASLMPDEKLTIAQKLKENGALVYVGDGINDAPVMATADCAVSMGKLGSAAAVEASDVVLIADDLNALTKGVKTAKKTRKIVMQNIVFSLAMKLLFMALGAIGILQLWLAVFADVGVMLLAVLNSFRVRKP